MLRLILKLSNNCRVSTSASVTESLVTRLVPHDVVRRLPSASLTIMQSRPTDNSGVCQNAKRDRLFRDSGELSSLWLNVSRGYAKKGKESRKESGKKSKTEKPHVQLSDEELNQVIDFDKMKNQMQMTLDYLKKDYAEQLSLRTSVGMLDKLVVDTPEGKFPLIQLGQVIQKNPQLMMINLAATPQYISCVKVAILESGINVNPQQEGTTLYIPVPKITREHREGLAKNAKNLCEKTKEKLRHIQNNFARDLKKTKDEHSEDLVFSVHETVLVTTKKYMDEAEAIMNAKQSELLGN